MFLKSLTLKGFKSFAETTTLEFEPGVTVVVGPNGSGKSNIVDAVAWVLGAQGPRTVRSGKMEDVIFAGSSKRPALGRAEVSLTIDNSAGLLPIDFSEVTITRTLFRSSGESEYSINGVNCRLLDITELLSDTGVGRQQHVIASQGQLDAILNARPEERRLVIEEAAGVLKYRQRRDRAQRRLDSTEANLLRLQDLLREVRRQLRPLERQADAARRHGEVVAELQALRLHLAGREVAALRSRHDAITTSRAELAGGEASLRTALTRLDEDVAAAESELSAQGGVDLSDAVVRLEGLRERARGLIAVLSERERSLQRALLSSVDEGVVASLEADAARLATELDAVDAARAANAPDMEALAHSEKQLATARAEFDRAWGQLTLGEAMGRAAEIRGELSAHRSAVERGLVEQSRLVTRLAALSEQEAEVEAEAARIAVELATIQEDEASLVAAQDAAEADRRAAGDHLAAAEARLRAAEHEAGAWSARAEALAMALDEVRARAGAERVAGLQGVVGTLLEMVEVDEGWQEAVEAALGDALAAVVVEDADAARAALAALAEGEATGAVLVASPGGARLLPQSLEPVRNHVHSSDRRIEAVLDGLLVIAVCVDGAWSDALDLALAHPDLTIVTRGGDRFSPTGWRMGAAATGATGAALEEARQRSAEAGSVVVVEGNAVADGRAAVDRAEAVVAELTANLDEHDARLAAATESLTRVEGERRGVGAETNALAPHVAELSEALGSQQTRVLELEAELPALEAEEAAGTERATRASHDRDRVDQLAVEVGARRIELQVRAAALDERHSVLSTRRAEVEERLSRMTEQRGAAASRRTDLESQDLAVGRLTALVRLRQTTVEDRLGGVREQRRAHGERVRAAAERLDGLRRQRQSTERQLAELRERAQRAEVDETEVRMRLEVAAESIRRDLDAEPDAAIDAPCPPLPPGTTAANRVREVERDLRLMGPINPLALEEFTALSERHSFLEKQLEDVRSSRRELGKVINAIDADMVEVFSAAYADVSDNFTRLFSTLFPGGTGRLRLTDPDNMLETGIEVEARPSGKNVRRLSLLSGGERSLTALAFLFAVFRSRPSPFYLLDEVEAALDDVNLHRFLDLLQEFRLEAQLLVVSHQKRTMEAADCLYGVTMQPGGSSRVISERITAGS